MSSAVALQSQHIVTDTSTLCHLGNLPDELILRVLYFLDIPELLSTSRTSHHLRTLSLDQHLHRQRLHHVPHLLTVLLPRRPPLRTLQPPVSTLYLTRMHLASRALHNTLIRRRLTRVLRRPRPAALAALVDAGILPRECCRVDRASGELARGLDGAIVQSARRVERERLKAGLRVWLERKADLIRGKSEEASVGVGVLVWRWSRRLAGRREGEAGAMIKGGNGIAPLKERVHGLTRFFESLDAGRCVR